MQSQTVLVQPSPAVMHCQKAIDNINRNKPISNRCEVEDGLWMQIVTDTWKDYNPEAKTIRDFVAQHVDVSYSTFRRRIRCSEWQSVFGLETEELVTVDPTRSAQWRSFANEDNYLEVWEDLKEKSDTDMKKKYNPDDEPDDPDPEDNDEGLDEDQAFADTIVSECFSGDNGANHFKADAILQGLLEDNGFPKTALAFDKVHKIYA